MNWIENRILANFSEILFTSSFFIISVKLSIFDAGNEILFQIKVLSKNIKETKLAQLYALSFTQLRVIRRINRIHCVTKIQLYLFLI